MPCRVFFFVVVFVLLLWMSNSLKHTSTPSKPTSLHLAPLFKLANQSTRHHCNYGENRNQPSWSFMRLLQTNHRPLPRSPVFNTVCRMRAKAENCWGFFPTGSKSSRRPTSCPVQLFGMSVTARLPRRVMVGLCCAVGCCATHGTRRAITLAPCCSTLLGKKIGSEGGGKDESGD